MLRGTSKLLHMLSSNIFRLISQLCPSRTNLNRAVSHLPCGSRPLGFSSPPQHRSVHLARSPEPTPTAVPNYSNRSSYSGRKLAARADVDVGATSEVGSFIWDHGDGLTQIH